MGKLFIEKKTRTLKGKLAIHPLIGILVIFILKGDHIQREGNFSIIILKIKRILKGEKRSGIFLLFSYLHKYIYVLSHNEKLQIIEIPMLKRRTRIVIET